MKFASSHGMTKLRLIVFLLLVGTITSPLYAQKKKIAVLKFDAANISEAEVLILTDRLRTELIQLGAYNVLERGVMEMLLEEQGFQQTGCVSTECVVEAGKMIGVEQIIAGSIGKIGTIYTVSARIVDVGTGEITDPQSLDCRCSIETLLTVSMAKVAAGLSGSVTTNPDPPILATCGGALLGSVGCWYAYLLMLKIEKWSRGI